MIAPKVEGESEGDVWKEISDSIRADALKADSAETVEEKLCETHRALLYI